MNLGLERNYRDRIGDISYEKMDWKKVPSERFRRNMEEVVLKMNTIIPEETLRWLENHYMDLKEYTRYNAAAIVVGLGCIQWSDKKISKKRFEHMDKTLRRHQAWFKAYDVTRIDMLRYARMWEHWFMTK
jgi:hypothetical protein